MAINAQYQTGSFTRTAATLSAQSMVEIKFSAADLGEAVAVYGTQSVADLDLWREKDIWIKDT